MTTAPGEAVGEFEPRLQRWTDYVLAKTAESSATLWQAAHDASRATLLICGVGFDPRTLDVPIRMFETLGDRLRVLAISLPRTAQHDQSAVDLADANLDRLSRVLGDQLTVVPAAEVEDGSTAGLVMTRLLVSDHGLLEEVTVAIDMSALPSAYAFPLVHLLLRQSASNAGPPAFTGDLQVIVSEDPAIDARIRLLGLEEPDTLAGFERLPDDGRSRVWVPVLGEGRAEQLRATREFLQPAEVCPVLPFPARHPRRADDLLQEHRPLLFDVLEFEPRNVLYAAEDNPFDLYRQMCGLAHRYRRALGPLGGATVVVSQHASKLLSLGVLLAAHEANLVVAHVRPSGYSLTIGPELPPDGPPLSVYTAWLAGQPFASLS